MSSERLPSARVLTADPAKYLRVGSEEDAASGHVPNGLGEDDEDEERKEDLGPWWLNPESDAFASVVAFLICVNAAVMGLETDLGDEPFEIVEHFFGVFFLAEMVIQIRFRGIGYFQTLATLFDFSLVVLSCVDLWVLPLFSNEPSPSGKLAAGNHLGSMLRVLRLMRILRVIRLFKIFKSLSLILSAFIKAFNIVLWVAFLTVLIDYVCAIFLTRMVGHNAEHWGESASEIQAWFGTIPRSMRTLFIVMTLAEWDTIALKLTDVVPEALVFPFFIFYILVASYTMVSLITGALSDAFAQAQSEDEHLKFHEMKAQKEALFLSLKKTLDDLDLNSDGVVTAPELERALRANPHILNKFAALNVQATDQDLLHLLHMMDDGSGGVAIDTLVDAVSRFSGVASATAAFHIQHKVNAICDELHSFGWRVHDIGQRQDSLEQKVDCIYSVLLDLRQGLQAAPGQLAPPGNQGRVGQPAPNAASVSPAPVSRALLQSYTPAFGMLQGAAAAMPLVGQPR